MEVRTQIQFINTFGETGPEGIIDVDTNSQFAIDFSISDIKDPFSRKGAKSYKFKIVGTKEVNQLLNHYYDINIVDGTYNNNHKQKIAVLRNGVVFADNFYLHLLSINKNVKDDVYSDQSISYEVLVGNDVTTFFTEITNKYLSDLNFEDMNHTYNSTNVIASFPFSSIRDNALSTGGYKYVLAATQLSQYRLEECVPAISVYEYWDRIHKSNGYGWQWTGYDSDSVRMDKLWIPYNGDKAKLSRPQDYEVDAEMTVTYNDSSNLPFSPFYNPNIDVAQFICDTEIFDPAGMFNPGTGLVTATIGSGLSAFNFQFEVDYELVINNPTAGDAYLLRNVGGPYYTGPAQCVYPLHWSLDTFINVKNNTTGITSVGATVHKEILTSVPGDIYTLPAGDTTLVSGTFLSGILPVSGIRVGDVLQTQIGMNRDAYTPTITTGDGSSTHFWTGSGGGSIVPVSCEIIVTSIRMVMVPATDCYGFGVEVILNDFVPDKIKQSDFVKAICNMYNLVADVDPTNDKKIVYTQRDTYYDNGAQKNWTSKLVTDKQSTIEFISNTNAKQIVLSYKADKDQANEDYLTQTKEIYGQLEYDLQNENIKGREIKETIFSPTPIGFTPFGTYGPAWVGIAPKCNIRILLDGGEQSTGDGGSQTYDIIDYYLGSVPTGTFGIDTYPMLTHHDNPNNPIFDINFGLCDYYMFPFTSQTNNNLYTMFWSRTIGRIDNGKLFTAYFNLNEYDISILKLSDKIFVKDTWYNINSLQYDPNSFGPTKAQLMTIDDQLRITFPKNIVGVYQSASANATMASIGASTLPYLNTNYNITGTVQVIGERNTLTNQRRNVLIVGNDKTPTLDNSIYTDSLVANTVIADEIVLNGRKLSESLSLYDEVQTTDATVTPITTIDIPDDYMISIQGRINGFDDGVNAAAGAFYYAVFRDKAGSIAQVGTATVILKEDFGGTPVVDVVTDGTQIFVEVTGIAATTINWSNTYEYTLTPNQ